MYRPEFELLKGSANPVNIFRTYNYNLEFSRNNPDFFRPDGILLFCGSQGSGKTLSAVQYVKKIMSSYPKCILCTNLEILGLTEDEEKRVFQYEGIESLKNVENGIYGVVYLIDEIHLEWNSTESKNISIEEMKQFSQQRKQRKHIVGTTQVYGRIAKPIREQLKNIILCNKYIGCLQVNKLIDGYSSIEKDGHIESTVLKKFIWFHSPSLYKSYDTFKVIDRYKKEWNGRKASEIYVDKT